MRIDSFFSGLSAQTLLRIGSKPFGRGRRHIMKKNTFRRRFRRLIKKQGSIMTVVLVVMASLLALAAGLLYAVRSERAVLVDDVSREQVYQMTVSANNLVFVLFLDF